MDSAYIRLLKDYETLAAEDMRTALAKALYGNYDEEGAKAEYLERKLREEQEYKRTLFVRMNRELLADSLETRKEVKTWKEFIDYYSQASWKPFTRIGYAPYGFDSRIPETTWIVGAYDESEYLGVLGMCSDDPGKLDGYPDNPKNVYKDRSYGYLVVKVEEE